MVRAFAAGKIAPFADEWDAKHYFPYEEAVKPMGELGLFGTVIPEEYGGNGMGWLAAMIITEEIARASSSLRVQINMQELGCAYTIYRYGSEELKKKIHPQTRQRRNARGVCDHGAPGGIGCDGDQVHGGGQGGSLAAQRDEDLDLECDGRRDQHLLCLHGPEPGGKRAVRLCAGAGRQIQRHHGDGSGQDGFPLLADRGDHPGEHEGSQGEHPGETGRRREDRFRFAGPVPSFRGGGRRRSGAGLSGCGDEVRHGAGAVRSGDRLFSDESGSDRPDGDAISNPHG